MTYSEEDFCEMIVAFENELTDMYEELIYEILEKEGKEDLAFFFEGEGWGQHIFHTIERFWKLGKVSDKDKFAFFMKEAEEAAKILIDEARMEEEL